MIILGLTGSIGMGKSTAARIFSRLGVPVFDADAEVHHMMDATLPRSHLGKAGQILTDIAAVFPSVVKKNTVDRKKLGAIIFSDAKKREKLEAIIHPIVGQRRRRFIRLSRKAGYDMVVLDIPLLFEGKNEAICDLVAVVTAPKYIQRKRVLARKNMDEERFRAIQKLQMPDAEKRRKADTLLYTGLGKADLLWQIKDLIAQIRGENVRT